MMRRARARAVRASGLPNRTITRYLWSFKVTPYGRVLIVSVLLAGGLGSTSLLSPIGHLFVLGTTLLAVALLCGVVWRPRLDITGEFPDTLVAGDDITGTFEVRNRSRYRCFDLGLGLFLLPRAVRQIGGEPHIAEIAPGDSAAVPVTIFAKRRGIYALGPLRPYTRFPFNLFRTGGREIPLAPIVVLPRYEPLSGLDIPVGRRYQPGGIDLLSKVGDTAEYVGNREYRPGDPLKHIDFHSWARLAQPFVREYHEEYVCRLAVVLDTYIPMRERIPSNGHPRMEAGISLAAAITDALSRSDYVVDVFAAGADVHVYRTGRHTAPFSHMLEVLAGLEPSRTDPFATLAQVVGEELEMTSSVLCVFLRWDKQREALIRAAVEADCEVRAIVLHEQPGSLSLGSDLADVVAVTPEQVLSGGVTRI